MAAKRREVNSEKIQSRMRMEKFDYFNIRNA